MAKVHELVEAELENIERVMERVIPLAKDIQAILVSFRDDINKAMKKA